jgi:RimJ/RimL family protein N-acetyltransferase
MKVTIRQLIESDWRVFSEVRLKALQTDPQAFGSNYALESKFTEEDWRRRLRGDASAIFMIFADETPIGITGVGVDRNDLTRRTALFWGSWLEPEFRRRGISDLMYKTRIDWARNRRGVERITVLHRASNTASKHAILKHGFVFTHRHEITWTDGIIEDEVCYEMKLKPSV